MKKLLFIFVMTFLPSCTMRGAPAPISYPGIRVTAGGVGVAREGDTIWSMAERYRLPVRGIIELNHLQPPYALATGRRLRLPLPVDYTVTPQDTLPDIARMFNAPVSRVAAVNRLKSPYRLKSGAVLRIPSLGKVAVKPPVPKPVFLAQKTPSVAASRDLPQKEERVRKEAAPRGFIWPVRGKVISGYGPKSDGLYNDGINIAAPRGTPARAAADGKVIYIGRALQSYGNLVLIRHKNGMATAYAHLASIHVKRGEAVKTGQAVGTIGSTGAVSSAQLHFEIRRGGTTLDPANIIPPATQGQG